MYIKRKPDFKMEIKRPNYDAAAYNATDVAVFYSGKSIYGDPLLSYGFETSLHTPSSSFNFTTTIVQDKKGLTWYEKIRKMDLVFIWEFNKIKFCGVIKNKRFSSSMGNDGKVMRSITFSGVSMGSMLSDFSLVLDQFLYEGTATAESASKKLMGELATLQSNEDARVAPILIAVYNSYFELTQAIGTLGASQGVKGVIDNFVDVNSRLSNDVVLRYPMSFSMYQIGINNIWDIISQAITPPINELFGVWNEDSNKYEIVFRQAPFEPVDWLALTTHKLHPIIIKEYDLGSSDEEVYTFYLGTLPGSGISRNKAMVYDSGAGSVAQIDSTQWKKYGYRPLIVDFRYFDRSQESNFSASSLMQSLSKMMKRWFEHNDKFLSGSITFMSISKDLYKDATDPKIGEKIKLIGGEFYIESSSHTWSMLSPMQTTLGLTRGYSYTTSGSYLRPIENVGRKIKTLGEI